MWQQQILKNKQFNNHNEHDKNNSNTMFILCVHFMYVENTAMGSSIKNDLFACVCVCICWESLLNQCVHSCLKYVCVYICDGPFVFLSPRVHFLWSLVTTCRVPVVSKRTLHASSLCVLCVLASFCLVVECLS